MDKFVRTAHFSFSHGQIFKSLVQGVPKNMGIQRRIRYSLCYELAVIPNFNSHNSIMSARVYFMRRVKDCKNVSIMSPQDEQ